MGRKTPPFPNYPSWTTARFFSFVRAALRAAFRKYPPKYQALAKSKKQLTPKQQEKRGGRQKFEYQCAVCNKWYSNKNIEVDHITPCGSLKSYDDLPGFVERMFPSEEGLQVICKACHSRKTQEDIKNATTS